MKKIVAKRRRTTVSKKEPAISFTSKKVIKEFNPTLGRSLNVKWIDMASGPTSIDTVGTGWSLQLDNLALGTAHNQRNGSKCKIEHIDVRIETYIPSGGDTTNTMRIVLFQITSNQIPTPATVLQNDALGGGGYNVVSQNSELQSQRYLILRDITIPMSLNGPNCHFMHFRINKKDFNPDITWNDTIGAPNANQGAIYMVAVADSAVAPHPQINWCSRIHFLDA